MPEVEDGCAVQLWLWPEFSEGIDLRKLRLRRDALSTWERAAGTVRAYRSDWAQFSGWCLEAGRQPLPASHETVSLYVVWMMEEAGRCVSTANRHLSGIAYCHKEARLPVPVDATTRDLLTSVRKRRRERPKGKAALSLEDLRRAALSCDLREVAGVRDRAALVLGFASGLRRSELAGLNLADVQFEAEGLAVRVACGKTDQEGKGRVLGVFAGRQPGTDPVRTLQAWVSMRGSRPGPLFTRVRFGVATLERLAGDAYNRIVKAAVERIGLPRAAYGAHSLRAGLVTAAAEQGASDAEIMFASGHASASVMRGYIRSGRLFARRNPLAGAL